MQKLLPIQQRGSRAEGDGGSPWKYVGCGFIIAILIVAVSLVILNPPPPPGPVTLKGEIYPYVEPYAPDDTTDIEPLI